MPPRIFHPGSLRQLAEAGTPVPLPGGAARHVQVLRLQPGSVLTLFDGLGGEWSATVARMGRSDVDVIVGPHDPVDRELPLNVILAVGMPANERMDTVVEKVTELGATKLVPLMCERSVLRLSGERAQRKVEHWQGVATAASEQSGRTRLPLVQPIQGLMAWLKSLPGDAVEGSLDSAVTPQTRWLLGFRDALAISDRLADACGALLARDASLLILSGPEGGLSPSEEDAACERGFSPVSLGPRVLRADTAPIAALAQVGQWLAAQRRPQA